MASSRKMIIVTSNKDVIRRFTHTRGKNTHIIHLDNDEQEASIETDDQDMVDLALFAELSEPNSTHDQVYKRALDSPQHNPSKPAKAPRKSTEMICAICGDQAIGYNYDVPSCASCKIFFHRYANQNMDELRCLTGQGQCSVAHETRRKCPKCRLERCFAVGMRKDFLLNEEEKQRRRKRLEEKRNASLQRSSVAESSTSSSMLPSISSSESHSQTTDEAERLLTNTPEDNGNILFDESNDLNRIDDMSLETLSVEDWLTVQSIRSSFLSIFENDVLSHPFFDAADRTSALINWSYIAHENALRFITFCRQISEFENLDADDRFILIKYHLFPLYPILKCYYHKPMHHFNSIEDNDEVEREHRFCTLCFEPNGIRDTFMKLTLSLVRSTEQDPTILSLLLTILLFYPGLSMNEDEPPLKDPVTVNQAQSYYIRVLWNYMNNKWDETVACKHFSQLLNVILGVQSLSKTFRDYFRGQLTTSDTAE